MEGCRYPDLATPLDWAGQQWHASVSVATSSIAGREETGGTEWVEEISVSGWRRSWDEPHVGGTNSQPCRSGSDFFASWAQPSCHSHHSVLSRAPACVTVGPVLTGKFIRSPCPQQDAAHQLFQISKVKTLKVYIFRFTFFLLDEILWYGPKIKVDTSSTIKVI